MFVSMINYVAERYKELRPTNKRMKKGYSMILSMRQR